MALETAPGVWRTQPHQDLGHRGRDSLQMKPFDKLRQWLQSHTTHLANAITGPAAGPCVAPGAGPMCSRARRTRHQFEEPARVPRTSRKAAWAHTGCLSSPLYLLSNLNPCSPERDRSASLACLPLEGRHQRRRCPGSAAALQVINRATGSKLRTPEPYSTIGGERRNPRCYHPVQSG